MTGLSAATDLPAGMTTLGQRAELPQYQYIELVQAERGQLASIEPEPGWIHYTFLVSIEAIDAATTYNPLYFKMRDDQAFEFWSFDAGQQPALRYGDLLTGQRIQGWLSFLAPVETGHVDLVYTPVSFYGGQAIFRVTIPPTDGGPSSTPLPPSDDPMEPLTAMTDVPEGQSTLGARLELPQFQSIELVEAERGRLTGSDPGPGGAHYTFLVAIRAVDAYTTYNPLYFKMRDDQGFEYEAFDGRRPALLYGDLSSPQSILGWLSFSAPTETAYVELVYTPVSFYGGQAIFRVGVP